MQHTEDKSHSMKIWYILIGRNQEGPYSYNDLKRDRRLTPDTLVWKEGFTEWKPIREIPELKNLFLDNEEEDEDQKIQQKPIPPQDEIVLELNQQPPFLYWILIALALAIYSILQLTWGK